MSTFDAYHRWLGIPPKDQPPHYYRLLGIDLFEASADVIASAADQRMAHVKSFQIGAHAVLSQQILNELAAARVCLLNSEKKAQYDRQLRAKLTSKSTPIAQPVELPTVDMAFTPAIHKSRKKQKPSWMSWVLVGIGLLAALIFVLIATTDRNVATTSDRDVVTRAQRQLPPITPQSPPPQKVEPDLPPKVEPNLQPPRVEPNPQPPKVEPNAQPLKVEPNHQEFDSKYKPPQAATDGSERPATNRPPSTIRQRLPIPDDSAQQKVLVIIQDTYKAEHDKDKAALASKLIQKAKEAQDSVERFVLLQVAARVAVEALHGDTAFEAIDTMAGGYAISASEMKAEVIEKCAKKASTPGQKATLAQAASQVIDEAITEGKLEVARKMGTQASQLARASGSSELLQEIASQNKKLRAVVNTYARTQRAREELKVNPTDPDANMTLGRYLCFTQGDWEKGLPMLAIGSDAELRALAEADIRGAVTPVEQVKLGDAWWEVARERAAYWYRKALPSLVGLEKDAVENKLTAIHERKEWLVILRSKDPSLWNTESRANHNEYAILLAEVPDDIQYLRIRINPLEYVIIETRKEHLKEWHDNGRYGWNGTNRFAWRAYQLGIYCKQWDEQQKGLIDTLGLGGVGYRGWGFGVRAYVDDKQGYTWGGKEIPPTVFEISVKSGLLNNVEEKHLLR